MADWGALSIQMVWFAADARRANAAELYTVFTEREPDTFSSNKVPSGPIPALSAAGGTIDGLKYGVTVQTSRVDLIVQANDEAADGPVLIESPDVLIELLIPRSASIGSRLSSINRIALVTTLFEPVETHADANKIVSDLIGLSLPRYDVNDLSLQLNARVVHEGPSGIQLNRLLKYGVLSFHSLTVELAGQIISPQQTQAFGASLAIDVNTVPQFQPLPLELQTEIWHKLGTETIRLRFVGKIDGLW